MQIKTLQLGFLKTNCYLVSDEATADCVIIDPGAQVYSILNALDEDGLHLRAILLTHGHFDHLGAVWPLYMRRPAPVYIHEADMAPIVNIGPQHFNAPPDTHFIEDGDVLTFGTLRFTVLACPGHTPGSVSFLCEDTLFSGDTLFYMDCGRCDYPCSDPEQLSDSLAKLRELKRNYKVLPGHFEASTLDAERANNPYLQPGAVLLDPEPVEEEPCLGKI